jgi:replication factor A1
MKISEILTTSANVSLEAKVAGKSESRDVNTRFGATRVAEATLEDDSGKIVLVLWGDQIEKVSTGDRIQIQNAYVKEWNGSLQLNIGKFGKITVLEPEKL